MRGQVTIFIIVGLFLVAIFGLILYVANSDELDRGEVSIDRVPEEFSPLQNYVHSCIEDIGRDAIEILGERGGYIFTDSYPLQEALGLNAYPEDPTEGNAFEYLPGTDIIVPYWYYVSSPNHASTLVTASMKPELESSKDRGIERIGERNIEAQIDQYVNTRLQTCLEDFRIFRENGVEISAPIYPSTTTFVTEEDVAINVILPVNVTLQGETQQLENFGVRLPVRLKDAYELAELITQAQAKFNPLEQNMNNLIAYYSGVNAQLPPKSAFTFQFGSPGKTWTTSEVKDTLELALVNTQLHQIEGTIDYPRVFTTSADGAYETRQNVYDDMIFPIVDQFETLENDVNINSIEELSLDTTDVRFQYLSWPIYFNANADGGVIRPETVGINFAILNFGTQQYETYYDISWPVAVEIKDTSAFSGEGFIFRFGLEGNIRDNLPVTSGFSQRRTDEFPNFCESATIPALIEVRSDDCIENECAPIANAAVTLDASGDNSFSSCPLGLTNESGLLLANVPQGVLNGNIRVAHPDYIFGFVPKVEEATGYTFFLPRLQDYTLEVKKRVATKQEGIWTLRQGIFDLDPSEQAIITFKRTKDREQFYHEEYATAFILPESSTQKIAAGSYEVYGTLLGAQDPALTAQILEEASEYEDSQQTLQQISQTPSRALIGGVDFNEENPIVLPKTLITSGNKITIYVLEFESEILPADIAAITAANAEELAPVIE